MKDAWIISIVFLTIMVSCVSLIHLRKMHILFAVPWISFSRFAVHPYENTSYFLPSVEAGKTYATGHREFLPLSLTCLHAMTDGCHVHLFLDRLQPEIKYLLQRKAFLEKPFRIKYNLCHILLSSQMIAACTLKAGRSCNLKNRQLILMLPAEQLNECSLFELGRNWLGHFLQALFTP